MNKDREEYVPMPSELDDISSMPNPLVTRPLVDIRSTFASRLLRVFPQMLEMPAPLIRRRVVVANNRRVLRQKAESRSVVT